MFGERGTLMWLLTYLCCVGATSNLVEYFSFEEARFCKRRGSEFCWSRLSLIYRSRFARMEDDERIVAYA